MATELSAEVVSSSNLEKLVAGIKDIAYEDLLAEFETKVRDVALRQDRKEELIRSSLNQWDDADKGDLFKQLLSLELKACLEDGERPSVRIYHERFGKDYGKELAEELPLTVGDYDLLEVLGEGAFARVFRGKNRRNRFEVAIKIFSAESLKKFPDNQLFQMELAGLSLLQHLDHPAIPKYHGEDKTADGRPCLRMRYFSGQSLQEIIKKSEGPLEIDCIVKIIAAIAESLSAIHTAGLYHRDLKPSNIIVGKNDQIHLIDFGLALPDSERWERRNERAGTYSYMPPERLQCAKPDGQTDIWSLGVILYELLSGRRPFDGRTPEELLSEIELGPPTSLRQYAPDTPEAIENICLRCLEKDRKLRYQTALDLRNELKTFLDNSGEALPNKVETKPSNVEISIMISIKLSPELRNRILTLFGRIRIFDTPESLRVFVSANIKLSLVAKYCIPKSEKLDHSTLLANLLEIRVPTAREPILFPLLDALAYEYRELDIGAACEQLKQEIMRENA